MKQKASPRALARSRTKGNRDTSTYKLGSSSGKDQKEHFIQRFGRTCAGTVEIQVISMNDYFNVMGHLIATGDTTTHAIARGMDYFMNLTTLPPGQAPICLDCSHEFSRNLPEAVMIAMPIARW